MNPFTAPKNLSPLHSTSLSITYPINTSLHFTSLHFTIHIYNSPPFTSFPFTFYRLQFPTLVSTYPILVTKIYINYIIKQKYNNFKTMKLFTALKNLSPLQFTSLFSLILSTLHFTSLCYLYLQLTSLHSISLYFLSSSFPHTGFHLPHPRYKNIHFTAGSPYCPRQVACSSPVSNGPAHKGQFPDVRTDCPYPNVTIHVGSHDCRTASHSEASLFSLTVRWPTHRCMDCIKHFVVSGLTFLTRCQAPTAL